MKDRPHCLVGANLQGPLQAQRRDSVFAGSKMPTDRKPNREWRTSPVKNGACHHGCAATTSGAHEPSVAKSPSCLMATRRADEATRPSQPLQVIQAVRISREPRLKLPKGLGVVCAGVGTFHYPSLRSTPVKWTPQIIVMDSEDDYSEAEKTLALALDATPIISPHHFVPGSMRHATRIKQTRPTQHRTHSEEYVKKRNKRGNEDLPTTFPRQDFCNQLRAPADIKLTKQS